MTALDRALDLVYQIDPRLARKARQELKELSRGVVLISIRGVKQEIIGTRKIGARYSRQNRHGGYMLEVPVLVVKKRTA